MGDKSARKKQYIIDKARDVFMEKGYKTVTMKDIVEKCEISRGGLYLYFDSTRQLFLEVLKAEAESDEDIFGGKISEDTTAAELLVLFLVEKKKEIFRKKDSLLVATYEYYFEARPEKKDDYLKKEFDEELKLLQMIIEAGLQNDEFICDDHSEAARNILYTIEGLKVSARTVGLSPDAFDKQVLYILNTLGVESED